jgi:hypothetical protein
MSNLLESLWDIHILDPLYKLADLAISTREYRVVDMSLRRIALVLLHTLVMISS